MTADRLFAKGIRLNGATGHAPARPSLSLAAQRASGWSRLVRTGQPQKLCYLTVRSGQCR